MNKVSIGLVVLRDDTGNAFVGAAQSSESPIAFGNVRTAGGVFSYSGSAEGAKAWAESHGLTYEVHELELDIEGQKLLDWKKL